MHAGSSYSNVIILECPEFYFFSLLKNQLKSHSMFLIINTPTLKHFTNQNESSQSVKKNMHTAVRVTVVGLRAVAVDVVIVAYFCSEAVVAVVAAPF